MSTANPNPSSDRRDGIHRLDHLLRLAEECVASGADREAFLAAHESERELLEPLLAGDQDDMTALPYDCIGDFELIRVLGSGGGGVVYEGVHVRTEQPAAVKTLVADIGDDRVRVRFQREARLCGSVQHENVVRLLSAGIHLGQPYLAMELVRGVPLSRLLAALGTAKDIDAVAFWVLLDQQLAALGFNVSAEQRAARSQEPLQRLLVDMLRRVAVALHAVHVAGIVHRDVKPANVLVCGDGKPVLTDFGVARTEGELGITLTGEPAGTSHYLAPEQHEVGADRLTAQTDVFSLGVTLYEAITLRRPFDAPTRLGIAELIRHQRPVEPGLVDKRINRDLSAIVMKAIEKAPRDRYRSAAAMAEDLDAWLRGGAVTARPMPMWLRGVRWLARNKVAAVVGAVLVLAAVTTAVMASVARETSVLLRQTRYLAVCSQWLVEVRGRFQGAASLVDDVGQAEKRLATLEGLIPAGREVQQSAVSLADSDPEAAAALRHTAEQVALMEPWRPTAQAWLAAARAGETAGWDRVRDSIRSGETSAYGTLKVTPQAGLEPLRLNHESGLWEFWHVPSGDKPNPEQRDRSREPNAGIVFVLMPSMSRRPLYFLAAHELTQAQWRRLTTPDHPNRSLFPGAASRTADSAFPLDTVAAESARGILGLWGLRLPSPQEWADAYYWNNRALQSFLPSHCYLQGDFPVEEPRRRITRPVGSLAPHPASFFDMIGNVWEIVYEADTGIYGICGGSFETPREEIKLAAPPTVRPDVGTNEVGLRACRSWRE